MLYLIIEQFADKYTFLNVFRYLTFRGILSVVTSLTIALAFGPYMIRKLVSLQLGQTVRDNGPQTHLTKQGTPTMGGTLILFSMSVSTLLWGDLTNKYVWVVLFVTIGFAFVGWYDDYLKIKYKDPKGIGARKNF
jgi:Phospho-N-acetylmuramoyl-pentapeptide-transferase (EC 2.7.8.13)